MSMSRGKQVTVKNIKGGLLTTGDPRRIPASYFRELVNAEYDRENLISKSKGYTLSQFSPTGHVLDIERVRDASLNHLGYLVASDRINFVDTLVGTPSFNQDGGTCGSKIEPNYSGAYFFLDQSINSRRLRRAKIRSGNLVVENAGIEIPSETSLAPSVKAATNTLWRTNGIATVPPGWSGNVLSLSTGASSNQAPIPVPPVNVSDYWQTWGFGTTFWDFAVDGDPSSAVFINQTQPDAYAKFHPDGSIFTTGTWNPNDPNYAQAGTTNTFFDIPTWTYRRPPNVTNIRVRVRMTGNFRVAVMWSIDWSGFIVTDPSYIMNNAGNEYTGWLEYDVPAPYWPYGIWIDMPSSSGQTAHGNLYEIEVLVTSSSSSSQMTLVMDNLPTVFDQEIFNRIFIPIRARTITTSRNVRWTITEEDLTTGIINQTDTASIAVTTGATAYDIVLPRNYKVDGKKRTRTTLKLALEGAPVVNEFIQFFRGGNFFATGDGSVSWINSNPAASGELCMSVLLVRDRPAVGLYAYSACLEDESGFRGNQIERPKYLTLTTNTGGGATRIDTPTFGTTNLLLELRKDLTKKLIIGRSLVGGGTIYELKVLDNVKCTPILDQILSLPAIPATTPVSIIANANELLDLASLPSGTPLPTDLMAPTDLNFLDDSIKVFRRRLWGIVKIPDASGVTRTFIRYSDVEGFDYWNPLNELSLLDDVVELQPFRDDVMLAFSASKVYRIFPLGDQFDWEKISDQGIGSVRMSTATQEVVAWYNLNGMWAFDGAQVIQVSESNNVINQIREMVNVNGRVFSFPRKEQIWFSGTIPGGINRAIIFSTYHKNYVFRQTPLEITAIIEEDSLLISPVYYGFDGALGIRNESSFLDNGTAIATTIRSKRFCSRELNEVRLQNIVINRISMPSGTLDVSVAFANGRTVSKSRSLLGPETGMPYPDYMEMYGTDAWFELVLQHYNQDSDFRLVDFSLSAMPIDLSFEPATETGGKTDAP